jgi:uncharacterized protein (TIGR04255 family)
MVDHPHLSQAPIVEALFDVKVTAAEGLAVEALEPAKGMLAAEYPIAKRRFSMHTAFPLENGRPVPAPAPERHLLGHLFHDSEEKTIVQFRLDGFTFNRMAPYSSWDELFPRAMAAFQMYWELAKPVQIDRVAVRYINKLEMALPIRNMAEHLSALPPVPNGLPTEVAECFSRIVIADSATEQMATITHSIEPSDDAFLTAILDIDAFCERTTMPEDLSRIYEGLRDLKNRAFFGCVTELEWSKYL